MIEIIFGIIAILAYCLLNGCYIPQIIKLLKTKSSEDVSVPFMASLALGLFLINIYFLYYQNWLIVTCNGAGLILNVIALGLAIKYKKTTQMKTKINKITKDMEW